MAEKAQMTLIHSEYVDTDAQGVDWYRVVVTTPAEPNLTNVKAVDIDGFPPNGGIAAGSIFLYPDKQYKIVYTDTNVKPGPTPGGDEEMIIHITKDETAGKYEMDKTGAEIKAAMEADKFVVAQHVLTDEDNTGIGQLYLCALDASPVEGGTEYVITVLDYEAFLQTERTDDNKVQFVQDPTFDYPAAGIK